ARLASMVGRRLREHALFARTVELKLRYRDFTTITRSRTLERATQWDADLVAESRRLFRQHWSKGAPVRLLGVAAKGLQAEEGQLSLLDEDRRERWRKALAAADRLRDRFGESAVELGSALEGLHRERAHQNPARRRARDGHESG
ncbi:MAG: DNA polymerase IV, partial [Bryobacteraceae bacterium]